VATAGILTEASFIPVLEVLGPDSSSLRVASSAEQHGKNDKGIRSYACVFPCPSRIEFMTAFSPRTCDVRTETCWNGMKKVYSRI
jgi:hypothetical protein